MALVILPCDLPHWTTLQRQLKSLLYSGSPKEVTDVMFQIYYMSSTATGLDPDESDKPELADFNGLRVFLESLPIELRQKIINKTVPCLVQKALDLKNLKPPGGFLFSLQQQSDCFQYSRKFVASLLAHAFFSTFPKRTVKTHPTLQDCNFTHFFKYLHLKCQQSKLLSFFHYFDLLESRNDEETITLSRQVLNGKQWLTIEDWLESKTPLCNLVIRNEGHLEDAESQCVRVCFSSRRLGGQALHEGTSLVKRFSQRSVLSRFRVKKFIVAATPLSQHFRKMSLWETCKATLIIILFVSHRVKPNCGLFDEKQTKSTSVPAIRDISQLKSSVIKECTDFFTMPEMIFILSSIEALEDNEALLVRDVYRVSTIRDPHKNAVFEKFMEPKKVFICCIDAENYTRLPLGQLAEDNLLRELNKALLGFRQGKPMPQKPISNRNVFQRRLSPIGESCGSNCSKDESPPNKVDLDSPRRRIAWLRPQPQYNKSVESRRGRFIVLGSSGECLPVSRRDVFFAGAREGPANAIGDKLINKLDSVYSSAEADHWLGENGLDSSDDNSDNDDVFLSARNSIELLDKEEEDITECSKSDDGYAQLYTVDDSFCSVDERVSFAERLKEALIRGATTYSSSDDDSSYAVGISINGSGDPLDIRFRRGTSTGFLLDRGSLDDGFHQDSADDAAQSHHSDTYSFTNTSVSSNSAKVYEQFSLWLTRAQDSPDDVNKEFVVSALKRAFSDSQVTDNRSELGERLVAMVRSLSLEMVKRNPKLAARVCTLFEYEDIKPTVEGIFSVATGNWGCGSSCGGDQQIKFALQWLAASLSGLPSLIYYTCHHHRLVKADTIRRVLTDRRWNVGQLTLALLQFAQKSLSDPLQNICLFDLLLNSLHN